DLEPHDPTPEVFPRSIPVTGYIHFLPLTIIMQRIFPVTRTTLVIFIKRRQPFSGFLLIIRLYFSNPTLIPEFYHLFMIIRELLKRFFTKPAFRGRTAPSGIDETDRNFMLRINFFREKVSNRGKLADISCCRFFPASRFHICLWRIVITPVRYEKMTDKRIIDSGNLISIFIF